MGKFLAIITVFCLSVVSDALAVFTMPVGAEIDLGPLEAWLGVAVVAYLAIMGYRKFVKTANRT